MVAGRLPRSRAGRRCRGRPSARRSSSGTPRSGSWARSRSTVGSRCTPARTGPIADVLYSAAGNSGDALWYGYDIFAWNFEVGTEFQPEWEEAHNEALEFSNGLVELMDVAYDFSRDGRNPRSNPVPPPGHATTARSRSGSRPRSRRRSTTRPTAGGRPSTRRRTRRRSARGVLSPGSRSSHTRPFPKGGSDEVHAADQQRHRPDPA